MGGEAGLGRLPQFFTIAQWWGTGSSANLRGSCWVLAMTLKLGLFP